MTRTDDSFSHDKDQNDAFVFPPRLIKQMCRQHMGFGQIINQRCRGMISYMYDVSVIIY